MNAFKHPVSIKKKKIVNISKFIVITCQCTVSYQIFKKWPNVRMWDEFIFCLNFMLTHSVSFFSVCTQFYI